MAVTLPTSFTFGAKESPATAALKYQQKASAAGQYWALGYLTAKRDPFIAASDQANYWLAQLNAVGVAGFQKGLARVNKAQVAQMVATSGPQLYNTGIQQKGVPRYTASITNLLPAMQTAAANLPPRGSDTQNDQRALAMIAYLRSIRGQFRSR